MAARKEELMASLMAEKKVAMKAEQKAD